MKDITIRKTATLKEAIKAMDETAENALLIVDDKKRLLGTLTDGDIRRFILRGSKMDRVIEKAYNPNPTYVLDEEFDLAAIKKTLTEKKIDLIPIVDKNHVVVDFITWEKAFGNDVKRTFKKMLAPVVIMAGGEGTRLAPFTKVLPKPLIPVNNQPIINHIIEKFIDYGISDFYMIVNYKAHILKAYFEELQPKYNLKFFEEHKPLGTVGGLKMLEEYLNIPFFLTNCDIIIKTDYQDLYRFHTENNNDISVVASVKHYNIPYGICELNSEGGLEKINEKPEYNFLVNTGLYIINPDILKYIPDGEFFHTTHLIETINLKGGKVGVYPISEKSWIDIGEWAEYRRVINTFEQNHE